MACLMIYSQCWENYGYRWKSKGREEYRIKDFPPGTDAESAVKSVAHKINQNTEHFREKIIGWECADDDFLTPFEQSQLDEDGEIFFPAIALTLKEENTK